MTLKGITLAEKLRLAREAGVSLPHYTNTDNPVDFPKTNSLIKRLADEAHEHALETIEYGEHFADIWNQKFAELLLSRVMSICEDLGDQGMDGHYCVDHIRREFGL